MNILFMGTPDFSVPILRRLLEEGYPVTAVVTQPDRPKGRKKELTPPPVKVEAEKWKLPVLQPEKLKNEASLNEVLAEKPDLIITAAFGQILPGKLLEAPSIAAVNVHASLLPEYRGGAPIHQAVIDGREKTGVTIMDMVAKLDAGDIIRQREVDIDWEDTVGDVHDKLSVLGADLLINTLPGVIDGTAERTPQNEADVTFASNIKRGQERIDWKQSGRSIYNQVRGMNPWPVAYTEKDEKPIKVWRAEWIEASASAEAGTITAIEESYVDVAAGDGTLVRLWEIQPAGKKRMNTAEFLRGSHGWAKGESFDE
ncbi:methionyl-tRNA formyltransferase [Marinococcus halophilus]|uniref:Methionyl-tRNA formyltransferase n=1 Tax=Marinococcus halophilus TaxID=1371 RepID=A0A510Y1Z4_MARHA|nr:methionyl-tRNA formyltransferase [Marinococcus halophilus]OZT81391.1 methionyl-tRNA formyltransferase [Marinococcus halophilus]GEK57345.1 methionyl-tRNA formyltransferase [Marinococcus halophilus]